MKEKIKILTLQVICGYGENREDGAQKKSKVWGTLTQSEAPRISTPHSVFTNIRVPRPDVLCEGQAALVHLPD